MADFINMVNFVQLMELQRQGQNRDHIYELDRRADRIGQASAQPPLEREEFISTLPKTEPAPLVRRTASSTLTGVAYGAMGGIIASAVLFLASIPAGLSLLGFMAVGAAIGGAVGVADGIVREQRPISLREQLNRYEGYLNSFEKSHTLSRSSQLQQEQGTKWREHAELSKQLQVEMAR